LRDEKRFEARKTGVLVHSLSGEGQVVSVYPGAINIRCEPGLLVSLIEDATQMTALSLHVPSYFRSRGAETEPGTPARFEKARLRLNGLCIDFSGATPWDGALALRSVQGFSLSKTAGFRQALLERGKEGGLLGLVRPDKEQNPFVRKASQILRRAFQHTSDGPSIGGLSQLIGLGPGLTPSGDDFIAGLLFGEAILSVLRAPPGSTQSSAQQAALPLRVNKRELWHSLTGTSDGGRTLLYQILEGHFPSYLIEVAKNLGKAQTEEEMADAVALAVSHGETSGTDALVGLWFYLKATGNHQRER
jgi:hypothetical protein